jgi:hypothetical protein
MAQPAEMKPAFEVYKDLYEIGEIPPLGHVPKNMYAWTIRKERHGPPEDSMKVEVVPTWSLDSHDVASGPVSVHRCRRSTDTAIPITSQAPMRPASCGLSAPR